MNEIIIVSGLGRCGTTLMMQLLHTAGMPVLADNKIAFEYERVTMLETKGVNDWLLEGRGKAVKVIDLQRMHLPNYDYKVIWMHRNYEQQAKSHVKFMQNIGLPVQLKQWKQLVKSFAPDTKKAMDILSRRNIPVLVVPFEKLLDVPELTLKDVCDFIGKPGLNIKLAVHDVIKRDAKCAADLQIEFDKIRREVIQAEYNENIPF